MARCQECRRKVAEYERDAPAHFPAPKTDAPLLSLTMGAANSASCKGNAYVTFAGPSWDLSPRGFGKPDFFLDMTPLYVQQHERLTRQ
jgi:hypothetical protein